MESGYRAGLPTPRIHHGLPSEIDLLPGEYLVMLARDPFAGVGLRRLGLESRDTLLILGEQDPEGSVAESVLRYGVGGLNVDGTRGGQMANSWKN